MPRGTLSYRKNEEIKRKLCKKTQTFSIFHFVEISLCLKVIQWFHNFKRQITKENNDATIKFYETFL